MSVTDIVVQTQPSALEWIAAGATAVSAVVIAWQAWQTRRSVQASEKAVDVAQAALTESQLARVESGVPRLFVTPGPPSGPEHVVQFVRHRPLPVTSEEIFKLPRDAERLLLSKHSLTVRNDGPGTILPRFASSPSVDILRTIHPIPPGTERVYEFSVSHPVARWIEILSARQDAEGSKIYPVCGTLDVIYSGPRDSDVDETHQVVLRGSLLVAVEDAEGDWRRYDDFPYNSTMSVEVLPATRVYWQSRSANVKFDTQPIAQGEIAAS